MPKLVKFIKKEYPDVHFEVPHYPHDYKNEKLRGKQITMGNLIVEKGMPPTRIHRFCCACLKESGGNGRITITGVRWAESNNRKNNAGIMTIVGAGKKEKETLIKSGNFADTPKGRIVLVNDNAESREMIEYCYKQHKTTCNPIIDWTDSDVWEFIHEYDVPYCELYDKGFKRLGCLGCPMSPHQEIELNRHPRIKDIYMRAFNQLILNNKHWEETRKNAQGIYDWWVQKQ